MEEMNGINISIKVIGEKIAQLESDLRFERIMKEQAETRIGQLDRVLGEKIAHLESDLRLERIMKEQAETRIDQLEAENLHLVEKIKGYIKKFEE